MTLICFYALFIGELLEAVWALPRQSCQDANDAKHGRGGEGGNFCFQRHIPLHILYIFIFVYQGPTGVSTTLEGCLLSSLCSTFNLSFCLMVLLEILLVPQMPTYAEGA